MYLKFNLRRLFVAAACVANTCFAASGSISVTSFGAVGDGITDNTVAFQTALTFAKTNAIAVVNVPQGNFVFDPLGAGGSEGVFIPSNVTLQGVGRGSTNLIVKAGYQERGLLRIRNEDNVTIQNLSMVGNDVHFDSYGKAVLIEIDPTVATPAVRSLSHIVIQEVGFQNFDGSGWVAAYNYDNKSDGTSSNSYSINDVQVIGNVFTSQTGNAGASTAIAYPSAAISMQGSQTNQYGLITNVVIRNNTIDSTYIKSGIDLWAGVQGVVVSQNLITKVAGVAAIPFDSGAYAISIYNNAYCPPGNSVNGYSCIPPQPMNGTKPNNIQITGNTISNPISAGVYVAGAGAQLTFDHNTISGQIDTSNATLPKGGIALNGPEGAYVNSNVLSNNAIGMELVPSSSGSGVITADSNTVTGVPANGKGVWIVSPSAYAVLQLSNTEIAGAVANSGVTGIFGIQQGGYLYIDSVAQSNTNASIRFFNSSYSTEYANSSQLAAVSPYGFSIQRLVESCASFDVSASNLSGLSSMTQAGPGCTIRSY